MSENLTFHNTSEQRESGKQPTVLLERSKSGEIVTATATGQYNDNGLEYYMFVENGEQKAKPLGRNTLSDQTQDMLAVQLAADRAQDVERVEYQNTPTALYGMGELALGAVGVDMPVKPSYERDDNVFSYLREALPPVVRPDNLPDNYDILLYGSDEEVAEMHTAAQLTHEQQEQQKYYDRFVTPANRQSSAETLAESVRANPALGRVLRDAGVDTLTVDAVDLIRENPDVRYEVAKYFAQKLDAMVTQDPEGFGWRIEKNSADNLKVDPQTGRRMKSRLYAVSLALKMLDGEFSASHEDDSFTRDSNGRVAVAQHRDAARQILFY